MVKDIILLFDTTCIYEIFLRENQKDAHLWAIYECDEEKVHRGWYEDGQIDGKAEFVLELLKNLGTVSDDITTLVKNQTDADVLLNWFQSAMKAENIEDWKSQVNIG